MNFFLLLESEGPYLGTTKQISAFVKFGHLSDYPLSIPSLMVCVVFIFTGLISFIFLTPESTSQRALEGLYSPLHAMDGMEQETFRRSDGSVETGSDILLVENSKIERVNIIDVEKNENMNFRYEESPFLTKENWQRGDSCSSPGKFGLGRCRNKSHAAKEKKCVYFITVVMVKTIGSESIEVDELKHTHDGEEPIQVASLSTKIAHESMNVASLSTKEANIDVESLHAYDNGSDVYFSTRGTKYDEKFVKLVLKPAVCNCLVVSGFVGFLVAYSLDLFVMGLIDSLYFSLNSVYFASFMCSADFVAVLFTLFCYVYKARCWGTLYLFYIFSQVYALSSFLLVLFPLSFAYIPKSIYYALLWILLVILASCSLMLILLVSTFAHNSCYSHERFVVTRLNVLALLLGFFLGSCIAYSFFNFCKLFREFCDVQVHACWLASVIATKILLVLIGRLPKKIQRTMREPVICIDTSSYP